MARLRVPSITTAQRTTVTPLEREVLYDTDLDRLFTGDGATLGGQRLALYGEALQSGSNASAAIVTNTGAATNPVTQTLANWLDFDDTSCVLGNFTTHYYGNAWGQTGTGRIARFNRGMFGGATLGSMDGPQTTLDYLSTEILSTTHLATVAAYSPIGALGIVGASRTSDYRTAFASATGGAQGVSGFAINDDTTGTPIACAVFGLAIRKSGVGGATENEFNVGNAGSVVTSTPANNDQSGRTMALNLSAGSAGYTNTISCLLLLDSSYGGTRSTKGIVVDSAVLDTTYGAGGNGVAVELYTGQSARWLDASDNVLGELWANSGGIHLRQGDSSTNSVLTAANLLRDTSGTAAVGIGVALGFKVENDAGSAVTAAAIQAEATAVTAGAESFHLIFRSTIGGTLAARLRMTGSALRPNSNDGMALGEAATAYSDAFFATGAVVGFGNNNLTLTHAAGQITNSGAWINTGMFTASGGLKGGVQDLNGAGAVNLTTLITKWGTTAADAGTLADGTEGQIKIIVMDADGGDGTLTPTNLANGTTITFNDVGDTVMLEFIGTEWWVISNNGCTVA